MERYSFCAIAIVLLIVGGCREDESNQSASPAEKQSTTSTSAPQVSAESVEKSLAAAQTYLNSRDVDKALAILNLLIDRAPTESRAYELLGQTYTLQAMIAQERGEMAPVPELRVQAYQQYKRAVELDPNSAGLHHSAGQMAMAAGDITAALEHFQSAGRLDPTNPQYPLFEAQLLIQREDRAAAKAALHRVLAIDAEEPFAHASLAMIAVEENDFETAQTHMQQARQSNPDDLGLRAQEAKIHRRSGNSRRGLELLVGLSEEERAKQYVATEIALCYEDLGQLLDAARTWQHVFQFNPVAPTAWMAAANASEYLLKAGEREQAYMWFEQARQAAPNAPRVQALEKLLNAAIDDNSN